MEQSAEGYGHPGPDRPRDEGHARRVAATARREPGGSGGRSAPPAAPTSSRSTTSTASPTACSRSTLSSSANCAPETPAPRPLVATSAKARHPPYADAKGRPPAACPRTEATGRPVGDLRPRRDRLAADRDLPAAGLHGTISARPASARSRRSSRSRAVLAIVLRLGITSAFFRFYFDSEHEDEEDARRPYLVLVHDGDGDARARPRLGLRRSRSRTGSTSPRRSSARGSSGSGHR